MDKKLLLDRAAKDGEQRVLLSRVLDKYEQAQTRNSPTHTAFLSPAEQAAATDLLAAAGIHSGFCFDGGAADTERRILFFLPDWQEEAEREEAIAALRCRFHESYTLSHRDFLGSLMAMGITREKLGDIFVDGHTATLFVSTDIVEYLCEQWSSVGRAAIRTERIALAEVTLPQRNVKEVRDTVSSLRLDAVLAAALSMSRAQASELIAAGKVQKNYREAAKADAAVAEGDVISARGYGKFELAEVGRLTKKGRTAILIRRYI